MTAIVGVLLIDGEESEVNVASGEESIPTRYKYLHYLRNRSHAVETSVASRARLPGHHIASASNRTRDLRIRQDPVAPNASNRRVRIFPTMPPHVEFPKCPIL